MADLFTRIARAILAMCLCGNLTRLTADADPDPCSKAPVGGHVVLESDVADPDVFLWDSRSRLIDYAAGRWGSTRVIFAHTVLAEPGTQAVVTSCFPGIAHPRFSTGDEDVIGVKVISGRQRGRSGWVLSSDIRDRPLAVTSATPSGAHR